ncbi:LSU ribosomal protein L9p [hydrothermal vent metagenome]|uniref:LSU ribosomal protein L9p n=1 Tax=hydrothermal vent metagenome TaxID=652676 RepID=A0A3B0YNK0_9ZZZZ
MEVILLEKVENLGNLGDRVNVKAGYGRNFLIPSGKATPATEAHIKAFEERRAELEKAATDTLATAEARRDKLVDMSITIAAKAGEEGKLFGSIGAIDIAESIGAAGVEIERNEVRLPEGAFRHLGEFKVQLHLHSDVDIEIALVIEAE